MPRKLLAGIGVALLTVQCAVAGVVAHWELDEGSGLTAASSVGGWTGTLTNFPDTSAGVGDPLGVAGWTTDGQINLNRMPGEAGAARLSTDFPLNSLIGQSFTVEFIGTHNAPSMGWSPLIGQSGGCCFFFGKRSGEQRLHYNINGIGSGDSNTVSVADGLPHHMALVFDDAADTMDVYFDHQQVAHHTGRTGTLNDQGLLWLGTVGHQPVNEYWNGYLDEVRISDSALTPANMLPAPPPPPPPPAGGVVGWWRMEDTQGMTAVDQTGLGNDGVLRNFADTSAGAGNTTESGWAAAIVPSVTDRGQVLANAGALRFDGSNDFVQTLVDCPTGSFTLEAIVTGENAGASWSPIFGESLASGNTGICYFGKRGGSGDLHYNVDGIGSADIWGVNVADGNPHHIALMFDETHDAIVVTFDHKPVLIRNYVTGTPNPIAGSRIRLCSRDDTHAGEKFDGKIDEARVWTAAVNPQQMLNGSVHILHAPDAVANDFESGSDGWYFMQNTGTDVGIIAEPGNAGNNVLQLIPAINGRTTAAIWGEPAQIKAFDAQFRFRIPAGNGADGFTFGVFDVPYFLGNGGGSLGYDDPDVGNLRPSFAIEFDTYQGGGETNENHVAIDRNYILGTDSSHVPSFDLENGQWAYCRVLMDNGVTSVWLNQSGFEFNVGDLLIDGASLGDVDLSGNGAFDPFFGYFGLTAATGGLNNQVIIDDLSINLIPEPASLTLLALGTLGIWVRRRRR